MLEFGIRENMVEQTAFEGGLEASVSSPDSCCEKAPLDANLPQQALFAVFGLTFGSPNSFIPTPAGVAGQSPCAKG